jgi:hypothetical protein
VGGYQRQVGGGVGHGRAVPKGQRRRGGRGAGDGGAEEEEQER